MSLPSVSLLRRGLLPALLASSLLIVTASAKPPRQRVQDDAASAPTAYGQRDDVVRFGTELAERRGYDPDWVNAQLAQARYVPSVARLIMPPPSGVAKNWAAYRARFVEPLRLRTGLAFWRDNEAWLQRAEEQYGVPPEIIVGVLGVETIYGRHMGNFRVIDALATLSFDFPAGRSDRSAFFRSELEQLLVLAHDEHIDPTSLTGSYAGAMGMGQFMPSSWNKYAIDFDGDGRIDLHTTPADVIGSIAHYFAEFGWQRGMPTRFDVGVPVDADNRAALLEPDIKPTFTAQQFAERGAGLPAAGREFTGLLALVKLENGDDPPSYVAGTPNFYAITRYNWSSYYAMAVIELGEAIKLVHEKIDR
ncbi:MAG: lytic murein transglycosylase B [Rhizobacter sp.]|nr:lytic murein transglycosylase B [Rhizobacter sp.]